MNRHQRKTKQTAPILLALSLLIMLTVFPTVTAHAAGWLNNVNSLTLGNAVSGSIMEGDYYGATEYNSDKYYWHIYRFTMPQNGLLNVYIESASSEYLRYYYSVNGFAIFSGADPDNIVWRSKSGENKIKSNFSSSRAMYYGSTEIALSQGDYYFAVRQCRTNDLPYYLTLSYKQPVINVTSITLNPSSLMMEVGEQRTISAAVLPDNATDKTVFWKSDNPAVVTVNNGTVTAVSNGSASITATSADGEISDTCTVTVRCNHNYQTSVSPATTESSGTISETCAKCGDKKTQVIYRINVISLSKSSYTYNGQLQKPAVTIVDAQGNSLISGKDYEVSYPNLTAKAGVYEVSIDFEGNYDGTVSKQFKILPKGVNFTKVTPKKNGIALKWGKTTADCGYEIVYSTSKKFSKKNSYTVDIAKSKTVSKTISKLKPGQRYYVRIRTYKTVTVNGKTTKLYSSWSKVKTVSTKK